MQCLGRNDLRQKQAIDGKVLVWKHKKLYRCSECGDFPTALKFVDHFKKSHGFDVTLLKGVC
jgi:hypothetical protein